MKYILLLFSFISLCCKENIKDSEQIKTTKSFIENFTIDSIECKYIGDKIINKREELIQELKLALEKEHDRPEIWDFMTVDNKNSWNLLQFFDYKNLIINNITYKTYYFDINYEDGFYEGLLIINEKSDKIEYRNMVIFQNLTSEVNYYKKPIIKDYFIEFQYKTFSDIDTITTNRKEYFIVKDGLFLDYFKSKDGITEYENYTKKSKGNIQNHLKNGYWEESIYSFKNEGYNLEKGNYKLGLRDGDWIISNENLQVSIKTYKNGKLITEKNKDVSVIIQENKSTPEKVVGNLIFTKDSNDSLQINTEVLEYISNNTTRENSKYLFALEDYGEKNKYSEYWTSDEISKIKAYIFNTTYPLRKKYWTDKFEEWYGGKPENYIGDSDFWKKNNYYGLPKLEEYVRDFIITHHWTQY
ncbi:hypothetical protein [Empedobacter tilapiae]|uniref:hypothetical protein n=1 Tax=Empedobacter tilapiae TaxID=2491114 RepID=UPI0028D59A7B|nr:hypothetical protein [Empedobacter tilapiae]